MIDPRLDIIEDLPWVVRWVHGDSWVADGLILSSVALCQNVWDVFFHAFVCFLRLF